MLYEVITISAAESAAVGADRVREFFGNGMPASVKACSITICWYRPANRGNIFPIPQPPAQGKPTRAA